MSVVPEPSAGKPQTATLTGVSLHSIRLVSGLILMIYLVWHLINHSLGLVSVNWMQTGGNLLSMVVRRTPLGYLLYAALAAHMIASLWQVYSRRSLKRMPAREWAQLILGLAIPPLMVTHIIGTRYASFAYGINDNYWYVLLSSFTLSPLSGILNVAGLLAAWTHGCFGMHMWLQLKPSYTNSMRSWLLVLATLLPAAALSGYLSAGREISLLAQSGEWLEQYYAQLQIPDDNVWKWITQDRDAVRLSLLALLVSVFSARIIRNYLTQQSSTVLIDYMDGPVVRQPIGNTLLEISRLSNVPHASVCGGRGRCSTCRVQIIDPAEDIEKASDSELKVLRRVNAPEDVRLACQLRPNCDLKVMRLLPADSHTRHGEAGKPWSTGQERIVAVLFADIRDFTRTAESRLPFDVVYLINQFSKEMGQAVEENGGRIDKFLGDGLMAIFGIETTPEEASRQALRAAAEMNRRLQSLNADLASDLPAPLRIGIGIHTGPVVLGNMGYGASRGLTAIGDTVNTSSRLEAETKTQKTLACVSQKTTTLAGIEPDKSALARISVRGREQKLDIFALDGLTIDQLVNAKSMTSV